MKHIKAAFVMSIIALMSSNAYAENVVCGVGVIVDLKEGGWNLDGLHIRLEGPNSEGQKPNTLRIYGDQKFVYYDSNSLSATRIEGIRRSAALAFAMGNRVFTLSHEGSCLKATELSILTN